MNGRKAFVLAASLATLMTLAGCLAPSELLGAESAKTEITALENKDLADSAAKAWNPQAQIVGVFGLADPDDHLPPAAQRTVHLTPRQLEVLRHLAAGKTTDRIAATLGISVETVRNHVRAVMGRLGAHTRLEAVMRAHDLELL